MQSKAQTVEQYLAELPEERREIVAAVRAAILRNLDKSYAEVMQYGMIGYCVPHSVYPAGYHCDPKQPLPFAGLASQKNHVAVYLMSLYGSPEEEAWFRDAWANEVEKGRAKKLDMGKSCIRFKKLEDVPLNVIGQAIKRMPAKKYIAWCEAATRQKAKPPANRQSAASAGRASRAASAGSAAAKREGSAGARPGSPRTARDQSAGSNSGPKARGATASKRGRKS
jgi:hypothetical protein